MPPKQGEVHARDLQRRIRERRERMEGATLANDGVAAVLRRLYAHIHSAADENRSSCTFEVPMGVLGSAPYDLAPCIEQLLDRLKKRGFTVDYLFPRTLFVYWAEDDGGEAVGDGHDPEPQPVPAAVCAPPPGGDAPAPRLFNPPPQLVAEGRGGGRVGRVGRGRTTGGHRPIHEFETSNRSAFALPY